MSASRLFKNAQGSDRCSVPLRRPSGALREAQFA